MNFHSNLVVTILLMVTFTSNQNTGKVESKSKLQENTKLITSLKACAKSFFSNCSVKRALKRTAL